MAGEKEERMRGWRSCRRRMKEAMEEDKEERMRREDEATKVWSDSCQDAHI